MAYDKKYIKDGDFVGDYLNDREDRIEEGFDNLIGEGLFTSDGWVLKDLGDNYYLAWANVSTQQTLSNYRPIQLPFNVEIGTSALTVTGNYNSTNLLTLVHAIIGGSELRIYPTTNGKVLENPQSFHIVGVLKKA